MTNAHLNTIIQLKKQFEPNKNAKKQCKIENIHTELTSVIQTYNIVAKFDKLIQSTDNKRFLVNAGIIFWEVIRMATVSYVV